MDYDPSHHVATATSIRFHLFEWMSSCNRCLLCCVQFLTTKLGLGIDAGRGLGRSVCRRRWIWLKRWLMSSSHCRPMKIATAPWSASCHPPPAFPLKKHVRKLLFYPQSTDIGSNHYVICSTFLQNCWEWNSCIDVLLLACIILGIRFDWSDILGSVILMKIYWYWNLCLILGSYQ
jgi:hypothetical protein